MSQSKVHADVAVSKGQSYFEYESYEIPIEYPLINSGTISNDSRSSINWARGSTAKSSHASTAKKRRQPHSKSSNQVYRLSILVRDAKIRREIKILNDLKGSSNICELRCVLRDPCTKRYCLVQFNATQNMEYVQAGNTMEEILKLS